MTRDRLIVRRRPGDVETPVSAMLKLGPDMPGSFLFESILGGERLGRYSFLGVEPHKWLKIEGGIAQISNNVEFTAPEILSLDPVEALRHFADLARAEVAKDDLQLPPMASGAFGYIGYDMVQYVEPVEINSPDTLDVPEVLLVVPSVVIIFDHLYQELLLVGRCPDGADDKIERKLDDIETRLEAPLPLVPRHAEEDDPKFESNTTKAQYFDMVERAKGYIRAGDIFQVVPSQRFSARYDRRSISFYRALRRLNPSAFMFHMNLGATRLVGSSPEILVRVRDGRVAIRPIAGTRPRSGEPAEDARRATDLLADTKEVAEHLMLLDLGRNDVGRVAAYGSVEVTEQFVVERYSHVMHIVSHVEGDLRDGVSVVDALLAGLPAGTVSGAPKIRAMQIIDQLEQNSRGIYGGAVGYFGWNGDLDTCIALRTAVLKDGMLHVQAGGGVVFDSDPQYEFDETLHKANALKRAAALSAIYEFDQ